MTKFFLSALFAFVIATGLTSCDSSTSEPNTNEPTVLKFSAKKNDIFKYDSYIVDTSDANGNNPNIILDSTRVVVTETVVDTAKEYDGRLNCIIVSSGSDSIIYSQSANGDLYRYNYGFDYVNSFEALKPYLPADGVNVGWVLVAKLTDKNDQSWVAVQDTILLPSFGAVYLKSNAVQKSDTTFHIMGATDAVVCKHVQHTFTATLGEGPTAINAVDVVDTYISAELGATVWDFFRSANVTGAFKAKVQGKSKIMTSHP
jgi:hypothetical protein